MNPAQNEQRENCARECHRHIRLCIPDVPLSAEKILGRIPVITATAHSKSSYRALIGLAVLAPTRKHFPLTPLAYGLILLHCWILFLGAHYTYAEVNTFRFIRDLFGWQRNNYDKLGHFAQGFVPAIIVREILLRRSAVTDALAQSVRDLAVFGIQRRECF